MRTLLKNAVLGLAAAALMISMGCDSEQPAQGGATDAVLSIETTEAAVPRGNMWEIWEEDPNLPPDGVPDRPRRDPQPNGPIVHLCEAAKEPPDILPYPWGFSVEVSLIRAGTASPVVLSTTSSEAQPYSAVTINPSVVLPLADKNNDTNPNDKIFPTEFYLNGKQVNITHSDFTEFCLGQIVEPNIGPALDNPASILLNKGDTIVVHARKVTANLNPFLGGLFPNPILRGVVRIGGLPVALAGTAESTTDDGAGISFSFTLN